MNVTQRDCAIVEDGFLAIFSLIKFFVLCRLFTADLDREANVG